MKQIILCTGFIFLFATGAIAQKDSDSLIVWNAKYRLTWNDFQAKPVPHRYYTAISACSISFEMVTLNDLLIYAYFNRKKSWVTVKDSIGLLHENGHFDITELIVRKFRKEYERLKPSWKGLDMEQFNRLFERMVNELQEYQTQYDMETGFSTNKEKQHYWLQKIQSELQALEKYIKK